MFLPRDLTRSALSCSTRRSPYHSTSFPFGSQPQPYVTFPPCLPHLARPKLGIKSRSKTSLQFLQHPVSWAIPPVGGAIDFPLCSILSVPVFQPIKPITTTTNRGKGGNNLGKRRCQYSKSFGGGPGPASKQPPQPTPNRTTTRSAVSPLRQ